MTDNQSVIKTQSIN